MGRNLVESTEGPVALGCGKVRRGDDGTLVAGRQGLLTHPIIVAQLAVVKLLKGRGRWFGVRCAPDPQFARWPRHSRGQPLRIPSIFRSLRREGRPGALPRRQPRWSEFLLGFVRDPAARRKSFPTALAVAWGDR